MITRHARVALGLATLAALGLAAAPPAHANFSGAYDPSKFTLTATAGTATITPTSGTTSTVDFLDNYNAGGGGVTLQTYTYTVPAAGTGTVTFTYLYTGNNAYYQAYTFLNVVDVTKGTSTALVPASTTTSGAFSFSGTGTLAVSAGDVFGFTDGGGNYDSTSVLQGDLKITNFSAPAAAPEPTPFAGLGLGILGLTGLTLTARRRPRVA